MRNIYSIKISYFILKIFQFQRSVYLICFSNLASFCTISCRLQIFLHVLSIISYYEGKSLFNCTRPIFHCQSSVICVMLTYAISQIWNEGRITGDLYKSIIFREKMDISFQFWLYLFHLIVSHLKIYTALKTFAVFVGDTKDPLKTISW